MAGQIGFFIGGFVILFLLSSLVPLVFRTRRRTYSAVLFSTLVALAVATVLGGYGMSEGNGPVFETAFRAYLFPAVMVLLVRLVQARRNQAAKPNSRED